MYKIKDISQKTGLSAHTLRYYDKEGLLPFVERNGAGQRRFSDHDLEWLELIACLKSTGMPIKQIRHFIALCQQGDGTLRARLEMFLKHRDEVLEDIAFLQRHLAAIECKVDHYSRALAQGSEAGLDREGATGS